MKKKHILSILTVVIFLVIVVWAMNYFSLQSPMREVLSHDYKNNGIDVSVSYSNYLNLGVLVYDLKEIKGSKSPADVFRVFLQYAEKMKGKQFNEVILQHKGKPKFKLRGEYFQKLGKEYPFQNPIYTMRTFPENLLNLDGSNVYSEWRGGLLGVFGKQLDDFNDFHMKWYIEDY